ncbi:MAG: LysR family transcriptional regulator [Rhizobiales bacterium]|nr:LysR family transcriptional regulator [Hyphomicrobiales bacterium]
MSVLGRRELDIRLLRVLQLLLQERSVSRVAERLGQSQPAVSATLRQLREIIGDQLLVRSGNSLVPTARAVEISETVDATLAGFDQIATWRDEIQPEIARRHVRIVASNGLAVLFVPRLVELLRKEAPGVELEFCGVPIDGSLPKRLESGEVDLIIGNWPSPAEDLRIAPLMETDIVCMARPSHPLAKHTALDLECYMEQAHVSPTPTAVMHWSPIDGRLAQMHRQRNVAISVPEYSMIPYVLSRADLLFTTARPFAEHLASFMPFSILGAPPELGRMKFYMLWHERAHNSAFERWLRDIVRKVAAEIRSIDTPPALHKSPVMAPIMAQQMAAQRSKAFTPR